MSVFTNPAAGAAEDAQSYVSAVLGLVGDQDPMEILVGTASWCADYVGSLSGGQRTTPEEEGKWSVGAVVRHLADSELVWGYRLRKILAEDRPRLEGYDQDLWADRLGYASSEWSTALGLFSALRASNLALIAEAPAADLDRVAVHDERGDESLRHMIRLYAGHDLVHRRQILRIATRLGGDEP